MITDHPKLSATLMAKRAAKLRSEFESYYEDMMDLLNLEQFVKTSDGKKVTSISFTQIRETTNNFLHLADLMELFAIVPWKQLLKTVSLIEELLALHIEEHHNDVNLNDEDRKNMQKMKDFLSMWPLRTGKDCPDYKQRVERVKTLRDCFDRNDKCQ